MIINLMVPFGVSLSFLRYAVCCFLWTAVWKLTNLLKIQHDVGFNYIKNKKITVQQINCWFKHPTTNSKTREVRNSDIYQAWLQEWRADQTNERMDHDLKNEKQKKK